MPPISSYRIVCPVAIDKFSSLALFLLREKLSYSARGENGVTSGHHLHHQACRRRRASAHFMFRHEFIANMTPVQPTNQEGGRDKLSTVSIGTLAFYLRVRVVQRSAGWGRCVLPQNVPDALLVEAIISSSSGIVAKSSPYVNMPTWRFK